MGRDSRFIPASGEAIPIGDDMVRSTQRERVNGEGWIDRAVPAGHLIGEESAHHGRLLISGRLSDQMPIAAARPLAALNSIKRRRVKLKLGTRSPSASGHGPVGVAAV